MFQYFSPAYSESRSGLVWLLFGKSLHVLYSFFVEQINNFQVLPRQKVDQFFPIWIWKLAIAKLSQTLRRHNLSCQLYYSSWANWAMSSRWYLNHSPVKYCSFNFTPYFDTMFWGINSGATCSLSRCFELALNFMPILYCFVLWKKVVLSWCLIDWMKYFWKAGDIVAFPFESILFDLILLWSSSVGGKVWCYWFMGIKWMKEENHTRSRE